MKTSTAIVIALLLVASSIAYRVHAHIVNSVPMCVYHA